MTFLFDTNVFLEILLDQDKKEIWKKLLIDNFGSIYLSDFSLHSIGVILLKEKKVKTFEQFLKDVLPYTTILSLPKEIYSEIASIASKYKMDFDDTYQALIAMEFEIGIKTMDKDFTSISKVIPIDIFYIAHYHKKSPVSRALLSKGSCFQYPYLFYFRQIFSEPVHLPNLSFYFLEK